MIRIFDMDGVLTDSMPFWSKGIYGVFDSRGITHPSDVVKILTPLGIQGRYDYFNSYGVGFTSVEQMLKEIDDRVRPFYEKDILLKTGVFAFLNKCKEEGDRLFVLTASPHSTADVCLKRNGVFDLFENVWSIDDFSLNKSDPNLYAEACKRIGCNPSEVCFYDDYHLNLLAAKTIGIRTIGVYDCSAESFTDLVKEASDEYITTF